MFICFYSDISMRRYLSFLLAQTQNNQRQPQKNGSDRCSKDEAKRSVKTDTVSTKVCPKSALLLG